MRSRSAAADGAASTAESDAAVLQVVFDDMLSGDNPETFPPWRGDQSSPVYVSKHPARRVREISEILFRHDEDKWEALTKAQLETAAEAANDLVARVRKEDALPELRSTSGRLKIFEDAGAATQPERASFRDRPSRAHLPGYSEDGRYAVVNLVFPWSIHSGEVTYILEQTDSGWKVLLRDFIFYM